jgi:hypothetical protein
MDRKEPRLSTLKALFAKSGNVCSFPDCVHPLVDDRNLFVGELCHINSVRKKDARFDPSLNENDLRDYNNLILLCHAHHKRVDSLEAEFPAETLRAMKATHEAAYSNRLFDVPDRVLIDALFQSFGQHHEVMINQAVEYFEQDIEETRGGQQGMNLASINIGAILDLYCSFLLLLHVYHVREEDRVTIIREHDEWRGFRYSQADANIVMRGGSGEIGEYSEAYTDITRARINMLKAKLFGPSENAS